MRFDRWALFVAAILAAAGAAAAGLMEGGASAYRHGPAQARAPADQEDAGSHYQIGLMYERGLDVPQDYGEARRRFLKAAAGGDLLAEFSLGVLSARGLGAPKDYVEAERWFRKAAEGGLAAAEFNLGVLYAHGLGVPQDYVLAHLSVWPPHRGKRARKRRSTRPPPSWRRPKLPRPKGSQTTGSGRPGRCAFRVKAQSVCFAR